MTRVRKAYASRGDDASLSRFVKVAPAAHQLALDPSYPRAVSPRLASHPAAAAGRTRFLKSLRAPGEAGNVLVSGYNNAKLGRDVRKGPLRGYWIYALSLEERATCPRSCHHWATCYGSNMPYAKRIDHREHNALRAALRREVRDLVNTRGRRGVLVRLHALGDFFSPEYVEFWAGLLQIYSTLAVFGYTAWPPDSPIGERITGAKGLYGQRFAIRWSNGGGAEDCTVPIQTPEQAGSAIVCPEQTGRTAACATCGLCWHTRRNIAFLEH